MISIGSSHAHFSDISNIIYAFDIVWLVTSLYNVILMNLDQHVCLLELNVNIS